MKRLGANPLKTFFSQPLYVAWTVITGALAFVVVGSIAWGNHSMRLSNVEASVSPVSQLITDLKLQGQQVTALKEQQDEQRGDVKKIQSDVVEIKLGVNTLLERSRLQAAK